MAKRKIIPALLQISVTTTADAEEAVVELLNGLFASPAAAYFNERTKVLRVSAYCEKQSEWTPAKRAAIAAGLRHICACGINPGRGTISQKRLPRENWAESWKRHFKPIEVGPALLLKPSWSKRRPRKGQAVIVLDPGLSFGTGHHATTGFCLAELVRCRRSGHAQSFLDIGTGSGILAIAAVKLGYAPVVAFDFDPESVRVAKENARNNRVQQRLDITQKDLTKLPPRSARKFDFICANLISPLLVAERERIVNRLGPGGVLVLAGILRREFAVVRKTYERMGLKFLAGRNEKEWRSGAFGWLKKV